MVIYRGLQVRVVTPKVPFESHAEHGVDPI